MQMCRVRHVLLRRMFTMPLNHRVFHFFGIAFLLNTLDVAIRLEIPKLCMQLLDIALSVLATPGDTKPCASFWTESERALLVTLRKRLVLTACAPAEEFIWVRRTHRRTCQPS